MLKSRFFIVLFAFLISAVVEFIARDGGGFTLAAFIFYGIYLLGMKGLTMLELEQKKHHENRSY